MTSSIDRSMRTGALAAWGIFITACANSLPEASVDERLRVGDYVFVARDIADTVDHCDPRTMSGYATASTLARQIADGATWDLRDEVSALALIDSFEHSSHQEFYSAVLLRSMSKADGYYAEPLGVAVYEELLKRPCRLLSCCWENGCDGDKGLRMWANAIAMEMVIVNWEDPRSAFLEYSTRVDSSARTQCDMQTEDRTHEFLHQISQQINASIARDSLDAIR